MINNAIIQIMAENLGVRLVAWCPHCHTDREAYIDISQPEPVIAKNEILPCTRHPGLRARFMDQVILLPDGTTLPSAGAQDNSLRLLMAFWSLSGFLHNQIGVPSLTRPERARTISHAAEIVSIIESSNKPVDFYAVPGITTTESLSRITEALSLLRGDDFADAAINHTIMKVNHLYN